MRKKNSPYEREKRECAHIHTSSELTINIVNHFLLLVKHQLFLFRDNYIIILKIIQLFRPLF